MKENSIICTRVLVHDNRQRLEVSLFAPKQVSLEEWKCRYQIKGASVFKIGGARGVDAFQALFQAITAIRQKLDRIKNTYKWAYAETGDHGFERFVPSYFGLSFRSRLETMIDSEINRHARMRRKGTNSERKKVRKGSGA